MIPETKRPGNESGGVKLESREIGRREIRAGSHATLCTRAALLVQLTPPAQRVATRRLLCPTIEDTGFPQMLELFHTLRRETGRTPLVVNSHARCAGV